MFCTSQQPSFVLRMCDVLRVYIYVLYFILQFIYVAKCPIHQKHKNVKDS